MEITYRKVDDLIFYEHNAKLHPDSQVARIAKSIQEFGFRNPVLVDKDNTLIAGHGRVLAARQAGLEQVPVIRVEDLTPEQVRAYRIADNKLAESGFYEELLRQEVLELRGEGIELGEMIDVPLEKEGQEKGSVDATKGNTKTCPFCGYEFE